MQRAQRCPLVALMNWIAVIDDQFEQALPQQTASALAAAAQNQVSIYLSAATVLRILCSAGWFAGGRSAEHPAINGVSKILLPTAILIVERELEDEKLNVEHPAPRR